MARRYLLDNLAFLDLISQFAPCPLADGTLGFGRRFTSQGHNLAKLFSCNRRRLAGPRCILQPLADPQIRQRNPGKAEPAPAPQTSCIDGDCQRTGYLFVVQSFMRQQHDADASALPTLVSRSRSTRLLLVSDLSPWRSSFLLTIRFPCPDFAKIYPRSICATLY